MLSKNILYTAIEKAFIEMKGVEDYYIFWNLEKSVLTLRSAVVAFKTTTIAEVILKGINIADSNFVIRDPKKLMNLLDIAENEIDVVIDDRKHGEKLIIKDKSFESQFTLCDARAVKVKPAVIEEPISYDFVLNIDPEFNEKYLKAKKANSQTTTVSVEVMDRKAKFELGDTDSYSNKIKFSVEEEGIFDMDKCFFSSDAINEIIKSNKKSKGRISVHEETLMKISYEDMLGSIPMKLNYFTLALDQL